MGDIIKSMILMALLVTGGYFSLGYLGYEINSDYFTYSKKKCQTELRACTTNLIHQDIDNVRCDITCIDPELIIKKKS